jgi:hypothetical protein
VSAFRLNLNVPVLLQYSCYSCSQPSKAHDPLRMITNILVYVSVAPVFKTYRSLYSKRQLELQYSQNSIFCWGGGAVSNESSCSGSSLASGSKSVSSTHYKFSLV